MSKTKFITIYEYGSGGIWQYVYANSQEQITAKYPKLSVLEEEPEWFAERILSAGKLREYDIEDEPDEIMKGFQ